MCNATERITAVQGHIRVNQGHWVWYQSKARICDLLLVINSKLGPILHRFGDTVIIGRKSAIHTYSNFQSHLTPSFRVTPFEFWDERDICKNYMYRAASLACLLDTSRLAIMTWNKWTAENSEATVSWVKWWVQDMSCGSAGFWAAGRMSVTDSVAYRLITVQCALTRRRGIAEIF